MKLEQWIFRTYCNLFCVNWTRNDWVIINLEKPPFSSLSSFLFWTLFVSTHKHDNHAKGWAQVEVQGKPELALCHNLGCKRCCWKVWYLLWGEKGKCEQVWTNQKPTNTNTKSTPTQKHKSHVLIMWGETLGYAQNRSQLENWISEVVRPLDSVTIIIYCM